MHPIARQALVVFCSLFYQFGDPGMRVHAETLSKEYKLKAAYLFNFTRFIEWPDTAFADQESPVRLCVQSDNSDIVFFSFLSQLVGQRRVGEKKRLVDVQLANGDAAIEQCHIAYIHCQACSPEKFGNALLVGDSPSRRKFGTVINFYQENNKIRFEVVLPNLERTQASLSSQLLKLARKVE